MSQRCFGHATLRLVALVVVATSSLLCGDQAAGQDTDPRYEVYVHRPFGYFPDPARQGPRTFAVERIAVEVERYLAERDLRFVTIETRAKFYSFDAVEFDSEPDSELPKISGPELYFKLEAAKGHVRDAVEALGRYDLELAEDKLKEAKTLYERYLVGLLNPGDLARVYETLGLVYFELGKDRSLVIEQFENMLRLDPSRVIAAPFFPQPIAELFDEARTRLLEGRRNGPDDQDEKMLREIAALVRADIVTWGYVIQEGDVFRFVMQVYRADTDEFVPIDPIELTGDADVDAELGGRLASRLAACVEPLPTPPPSAPDRERGHVYLDTAFTYYIFLKSPTQQFFDNFGFALSGSYMLFDNFALLLRVNFLTSAQDVNGDLLTEFSSIRAFAGGGFSFKPWSWFRPFVTFSLEGTRVGEFESTGNFFCKINKEAPDCDADDVTQTSPGFLMGTNLQAGAAVRLFKDLSFYATGSGSFYVVPLQGKELDLPVGLDTGLEYRF